MRSYYAVHMGTLQITMTDGTGEETLLFTRSGNQDKEWIEEKINIPAVDDLKVRKFYFSLNLKDMLLINRIIRRYGIQLPLR